MMMQGFAKPLFGNRSANNAPVVCPFTVSTSDSVSTTKGPAPEMTPSSRRLIAIVLPTSGIAAVIGVPVTVGGVA
jgi:hypothetical protein